MNALPPSPTADLRPEPRRRALAAAACLLIAGVLAAWWAGAFDDRAAPSSGLTTPPDADGSVGARTRAGARSPSSTPAARTDESSDPSKNPEPEHAWTGFGRCVDEHGNPLSGVEVKAWLGSEEPPSPTENDCWSAKSGTDGRFELHATVDGHHDGTLRCAAAGRVPVAAKLRRPLPGESVDLGDLVLAGAITVEGRVVDTQGAAVVGARVMFVRIDPTETARPSGVGTEASPQSMLVAFSEADGRLRFDLPAWPGEWFIGVEYTGALVGPRNVALDASMTEFDLRIVVERPDPRLSVTGKVVDDLGHPVQGARVQLTGHGFVGRGLSDVEGNVVVVRAGPALYRSRTEMSIDVDHENGRYEWPEDAAKSDIEWGAKGVEFRLLRRASRVIRVVDSRGEAVEDYVLHAYSRRPSGALMRYSRHKIRGHHPDGRSTLEGLYQGSQAILVVPDDPRLASTELVAFEVSGVTAGPEVVVVAPDVSTCEVTVVTTGGGAVDGSAIELVQLLADGDLQVPTRTIPLADVDRSRSVERVLALAAATTDASGRASITAPPGHWNLVVRGDDHVDRVQKVFVGPGHNPIDVVVEVGATVRGRIHPAPVVAQLLALDDASLLVEMDPGQGDPAKIQLTVDRDGVFSSAGLAAGTYEMLLRVRYDSSEFHTARDAYPIGTCSLTKGATETVEYDATECVPLPVDGRVTVDGAPLAGVHCFLRAVNSGGPLMIRVGTDTDGRFETLLRPAEYRLIATMPARPGPGWLRIPTHDRTWRVSRDQPAHIDAAIQLRRATLRVVDANGEPVAHTAIRVSAKDYGDPTPKRTGADGSVRIDPAPAGDFEVEIGADDSRVRLGPYALPAGRLDGTITIRVE